MAVEASGIEQGQRRLNGIQTAGREFRNLSEPSYRVLRVESVPAETRDGTTLMTDVYRPDAEGRFPRCSPSRPTRARFRTCGRRWVWSRPEPATSSCRGATST